MHTVWGSLSISSFQQQGGMGWLVQTDTITNGEKCSTKHQCSKTLCLGSQPLRQVSYDCLIQVTCSLYASYRYTTSCSSSACRAMEQPSHYRALDATGYAGRYPVTSRSGCIHYIPNNNISMVTRNKDQSILCLIQYLNHVEFRHIIRLDPDSY